MDEGRVVFARCPDFLVCQMPGVPATSWGTDEKWFDHQTLLDNVALLDGDPLPVAAAYCQTRSFTSCAV